MIGAAADEVIVTGSTTTNLHQLVATFYKPTPARRLVVADELNFPSDIYALESQLRLHNDDPAARLIMVSSRDGRTLEERDIEAAFTEQVALAILPTVLYRSGQLLDVAGLTAAAHRKRIIIGFDCSHSIGVIPHNFSASDVDFAFWCSYKYLNGGPGAPAGLYLNRRHFGTLPGLAGWWGNDKTTQFDMRLTYEPAPAAGAMQIGTPPILATAGILSALEITAQAGIEELREKSLRLTEYLMYLAERELAQFGFTIGTPRDSNRRGAHVALEHPHIAVRVNQALRSRGIITDFRPPDIIRLAPVPLYNTFHEVWKAVQTIKGIVKTGQYENFENQRDPVA
jgi:kynureninase